MGLIELMRPEPQAPPPGRLPKCLRVSSPAPTVFHLLVPTVRSCFPPMCGLVETIEIQPCTSYRDFGLNIGMAELVYGPPAPLPVQTTSSWA